MKSKKTTIIVFDPKKLLKYLNESIRGNLFSERFKYLSVRSFWSWLNRQPKPVLAKNQVTWAGPGYRVYSSQFSPISVLGSVAHGGRLNIGGSQLKPLSPSIGIFGAIYCSEDLVTAELEANAGGPIGPGEMKYELLVSRPLMLWDFDKIVNSLAFPGLQTKVKQTPFSAIWKYCKIPMESQLIAFWLKQIGGDGFIFDSTRNPGKKNIVILAKDDHDAGLLIHQVNTLP